MFDIQRWPKWAGIMNTKMGRIKKGVGRKNVKLYKIGQLKICNVVIVWL